MIIKKIYDVLSAYISSEGTLDSKIENIQILKEQVQPTH